MKKFVELPLVSPVYSTYHYQGSGCAMIAENPSIKNWYLSDALMLNCTREFRWGRTTPDLEIESAKWFENPYFEVHKYPMRFLKGRIHSLIRNLLDEGYYVIFEGIDDYYVEGKSWYKECHFFHDGAICGYNSEDKTYCIYAYDSNWIYRKFWTPIKGFEKGRKSMFNLGRYGTIYGVKPKRENVEFSVSSALENIKKYISSKMEDYEGTKTIKVYGITVQDYLVLYLERLLIGKIPYGKMDRRIFRLIWEHKKAMYESIKIIEEKLHINSDTSQRYIDFIEESDKMRMLYASYHMKRRDSILPIIQNKLTNLRNEEQKVLEDFINMANAAIEKSGLVIV